VGNFTGSFRGAAQALFKLDSSVGANVDAGGGEEEEGKLVTRKQKIARALKQVLEAIKTVGVSHRSGLPEHGEWVHAMSESSMFKVLDTLHPHPTPSRATPSLNLAVRELLETLVAEGELAQEDVVDVMLQTTPTHADLYLESQMSKGQAAIETLLFTYADLATDVLMIVQYYADGRLGVATLMLAVLGFSLVVQALCGHFCGQGQCITGRWWGVCWGLIFQLLNSTHTDHHPQGRP
jgi:hypothetical protein